LFFTNGLATKVDIASFLKVPEPTLTSFLAKYESQIIHIKLIIEKIRAAGKKYKQES
jgi:hypothetical protein